jgi:hypothetical protein
MTIKQLFENEENRWNSIYTLIYIVLVFVFSGLVWLVDNQFPKDVSWFDFMLLVLATFRLVRLFVYDRVMLFVRDYFASASGGALKTAGDLLNCPWCFGMWAGTFVAFFYFVMPMAWFVILILAISGLATFIQVLINMIGWRAEHSKMETQAKRPPEVKEVGPKV